MKIKAFVRTLTTVLELFITKESPSKRANEAIYKFNQER